jgi:hypothetical protein
MLSSDRFLMLSGEFSGILPLFMPHCPDKDRFGCHTDLNQALDSSNVM